MVFEKNVDFEEIESAYAGNNSYYVCPKGNNHLHIFYDSSKPATKIIPDNFVNNGESLYICSHNTGNGKTSWALKLMYKLFSSQYDEVFIEEPLALFIYVTDFLLQLKDFNNPLSQKYLNYVKTVPLVIWDDIGTGTLSDYDYTQLLTYINARQQAQLSNIFTSNLITLDELSSKVGDKLASRIFNSSTIIELKGKDMR